jgi:CheY-like chemotaxis protein
VLNAKNILVVEDDPILSLDLVDTIERAGGTAVGPAHTVDQALKLAASEALDAAVLDVWLGSRTSFEVADRLDQRGIPYLFQTGHPQETSRRSARPVPTLEKPVAPERLLTFLVAILSETSRA